MVQINNIRANGSEGKIIAYSIAIAIIIFTICKCLPKA